MSINLFTVSNWSLLLMSVRFCVLWLRQYILQQRCLKKWIGSALIGSQWYNFQFPTPTLSSTMHSVTDRQTDRQTTVSCQN